jgi:hypothetical protein
MCCAELDTGLPDGLPGDDEGEIEKGSFRTG